MICDRSTVSVASPLGCCVESLVHGVVLLVDILHDVADITVTGEAHGWVSSGNCSHLLSCQVMPTSLLNPCSPQKTRGVLGHGPLRRHNCHHHRPIAKSGNSAVPRPLLSMKLERPFFTITELCHVPSAQICFPCLSIPSAMIYIIDLNDLTS